MKSTVSLRRRQQGLSIIEVMVSLVIGMVVVSAVLFSYLGSGITGKSQSALAQMNEDVMIAFSVMSRDLQMAGFSEPNGITVSAPGGTATFGRLFTGRAVFGCDRALIAPNATNAVTCSTSGATTTHSIEVNYQATAVNSVPNGAGVPTDCLGNGLSISGTYYISSNRYYVTPTAVSLRPELHCASSGQSGQPLVENVEAMKLWYGEANAIDPRRAVRYIPASSVGDWGRVISVRVCMLMRSAEPVLEADDPVGATYTDCDGVSVTPTDRRMYRAFFSTVALRNRMGL